jgi:hypothetical protein
MGMELPYRMLILSKEYLLLHLETVCTFFIQVIMYPFRKKVDYA